MHLYTLPFFTVAVLFSFGTPGLFAQNVTSSSSSAVAGNGVSSASFATNSNLSSQEQTIFLAYRKEQEVLQRGYVKLMESGATAEQIQAWEKSNASRFQAQAQRAQAMSLLSANDTVPTNGSIQLPSGLSSTGTVFLSGQLALARAFASDRTQELQGPSKSGGPLTATQLTLANKSAIQTFVQENAAAITQQRQRAAALATDTSADVSLPPSALVVPAGATASEISFLKTREQLRQQFAQFRKQYAAATPAAREIALKQWQEQNAALVEQFQNQAQNLSQDTSQN